jgi:hypothetical protein
LSGSERNKLLARLIQQTVEALDKLINDGEQTLSSITSSDIKGILRSLKGRNNDIMKELEIVSNYFRDQQSQSAVASGVIKLSDINQRSERLHAAVEILRLTADIETHGFKVSPLPDAVEFLKTIVCDDSLPAIDSLQRFVGEAMNHNELSLKNVVHLLKSIQEILMKIDYHHLQILGTLKHGHHVLQFLQSEKDVVGQIAMLTQVSI